MFHSIANVVRTVFYTTDHEEAKLAGSNPVTNSEDTPVATIRKLKKSKSRRKKSSSISSGKEVPESAISTTPSGLTKSVADLLYPDDTTAPDTPSISNGFIKPFFNPSEGSVDESSDEWTRVAKPVRSIDYIDQLNARCSQHEAILSCSSESTVLRSQGNFDTCCVPIFGTLILSVAFAKSFCLINPDKCNRRVNLSKFVIHGLVFCNRRTLASILRWANKTERLQAAVHLAGCS